MPEDEFYEAEFDIGPYVTVADRDSSTPFVVLMEFDSTGGQHVVKRILAQYENVQDAEKAAKFYADFLKVSCK